MLGGGLGGGADGRRDEPWELRRGAAGLAGQSNRGADDDIFDERCQQRCGLRAAYAQRPQVCGPHPRRGEAHPPLRSGGGRHEHRGALRSIGRFFFNGEDFNKNMLYRNASEECIDLRAERVLTNSPVTF
eukprot:4183821-Pyramimonas_sp.AAC.1